MHRIVLVSTPWPLYNRPSIQLGTLKAYLRQEMPDLEILALHAYLKVAEAIGYKVYQSVSERTWLAESVYGALLHPERSEQCEKLFTRKIHGKREMRNVDFKALTAQVKDLSDSLIRSVDWGSFSLAGFSMCLCQLTSSLYFIRQVKKRCPGLSIVVGGSMFAGDSNRGLLRVFPEIDFAVNGEGERPLSHLVRHLTVRGEPHDVPPVAGLVAKDSAFGKTPVSFSQMKTLRTLPAPEYDDYFRLLRTFSPEKVFFPTLPAEISRGCWWRRTQGAVKDSGCAFCNLNLQWTGYRSKSPEQAAREIDHLSTKHQALSMAFTDNLLPLKSSRKVFERTEKLGKDFRFFGEIRATTSKPVLEAMKAAGADEVQIGIEALSTRLLKKLNKGTTAIQNLQIMKECEGLGIANVSNLILHFPGSDREDVEETLRALDFAEPFHPLKFVHFWLGLGSPVAQNPSAFGLKAVFNHPNYSFIFPQDVLRSIRFMIQGYRGDLGRQRRLWLPVKKRMEFWKKTYREIHAGPDCSPILSFRDGGDFMILRQKRSNRNPMTHRLTGNSRRIYLFCQTHRSIEEILARFPGVGVDRVVPFLKMMVQKKLMFDEKDNFLSLAVPVRK